MFRFLTGLFASDDTPAARPARRTVLGADVFGLEPREVPAALSATAALPATAAPAPVTQLADQLAAPALARADAAVIAAQQIFPAAAAKLAQLQSEETAFIQIGLSQPFGMGAPFLVQAHMVRQKADSLRAVLASAQADLAPVTSSRAAITRTLTELKIERQVAAYTWQPMLPLIQKQNEKIQVEVVKLAVQTQTLQSKTAILKSLIAQ